MRFVPLVIALAVLGTFAAGAGATTASPAGANSLCSYGKSVAKALIQSGQLITPKAGESLATLESQLKTNMLRIQAAEHGLIAASSGSIRTDLVKVFAFDNFVIAKLKAANWNFAALASQAAALEAKAQAVKPQLLALKAYFNKCK
jgi:hypothetical protein